MDEDSDDVNFVGNIVFLGMIILLIFLFREPIYDFIIWLIQTIHI